MYRCKECDWTGYEIFEHGISPCCPECGGDIKAKDKPSDLDDLLECPTDEEIYKAAKQFRDEQGETPSSFAFQAGARWAREMQKLCKVCGAT